MENSFEEISRRLKDGEMDRTVRLITCGMCFDFDLLKLNNLFPQNILQALVRNNQTPEKAPDRATILRLNIDTQSIRLIYSYYNTLTLIIPESQIDQELLLNTCDYLGFVEISKQIERILLPEPDGLDFVIADDTETHVEPEMEIEESDDYITIKCNSGKNPIEEKRLLYTLNSKCMLSALDKDILTKETILRKEYAQGERPPIPRIEFVSAFKDRLVPDHPYTFVNSPNKSVLDGIQWIDSNEEFLENLKMYSLGILDENMPASLVVAGSAALKCCMKLNPELIPAVYIRELSTYLPSYAEINDDYLTLSRLQRQPNNLNDYPKEKLDFLAKLILAHPKRANFKIVNNAGHRRNRPELLINYFKNLSRNTIIFSNDIDLFITTSDPNIIVKSIRYIHDQMVKKFGTVHILRSENSISFFTDDEMVPPIQIILRAYDSVEHVLLGFDVDACCIGFDGRVICSDRFLRAIRYGYNLIDLTRLSPTYEIRLMKYYARGFDIAMTEPVIEEQTEKILSLTNKYGSILFAMLRGIYKLSYLLIAYNKLARIPKAQKISDYSYGTIDTVINSLYNGLEKINFVYGVDLDKVLFEGISYLPNPNTWRQRRFIKKINAKTFKDTTLGPLRIMRRNVTKQSDTDELFTGSFNPIQMAWYEGSIII